jgi:hypothetical protein
MKDSGVRALAPSRGPIPNRDQMEAPDEVRFGTRPSAPVGAPRPFAPPTGPGRAAENGSE